MGKCCSLATAHAFLCFGWSMNSAMGPAKKCKCRSNADALLNKRTLNIFVKINWKKNGRLWQL